MVELFVERAEQAVRIAWASGLRPEPAMTVSAWADEHRRLFSKQSPEPGRWHTPRTPWTRDIMDALSATSPYETVACCKGSQIAGTECGNNWIGYVIDQAPGPMLAVSPTVELAKRASRQRIEPMVEETPRLAAKVRDKRERESGNTLLAKEFPGGVLVLTGANSAVGLRSMPARYLFLDEVDAYPLTADEEGDPIDLARRATRNFRQSRNVFIVSTALARGTSRIEREVAACDIECEYHVPCPYCGHRQALIRASFVHDVLYQLIRRRKLPPEVKAGADDLLFTLCLEDGMWKAKAWLVRWGVRTLAAPGDACRTHDPQRALELLVDTTLQEAPSSQPRSSSGGKRFTRQGPRRNTYANELLGHELLDRRPHASNKLLHARLSKELGDRA